MLPRHALSLSGPGACRPMCGRQARTTAYAEHMPDLQVSPEQHWPSVSQLMPPGLQQTPPVQLVRKPVADAVSMPDLPVRAQHDALSIFFWRPAGLPMPRLELILPRQAVD